MRKEISNDPELLDLDGQNLVGNNQDHEACEQFREAIKLAPTQINAYVHLADVLRARLARCAEADQVMKDMVENNPKSVSALQKYAYYLRENERFEEALVQAKRVLELAPDNSVGLWLCGCCYLSLGEAAKNLSENPFHELTAQDAWKGGSGIGSKAEECYKTAEDYLNRGIKADKSDRAMYMVMADVKIHLGRRDQAIEVLRQGLEATRGSDGYASLLYDLTNACISEARFAEAEKCIKELRESAWRGTGPFRSNSSDFSRPRWA